jgi:creatinine amidohydrolase
VELYEMTWPKVAALSKDMPVVIPIAALEQHGRHMPVFTDSMLLGEVMRRVKESFKDTVLFTPLMWLGNSHHHLDFPGTLSASPRVYMDLLIDLAENLIFHGFRRIVFVNGHGGNIVPAQQALFELRQKVRAHGDLLLVSTTYWSLGGKPYEVDPTIKQQQMGHACEWETSMMLHIAPHLVGDLTQVIEVPFGSGFAPAHRAWITKERTEPGHIGDPRHATADKGESLFRVFSADVVAFLETAIAWDGKTWDAPENTKYEERRAKSENE